MLLNKLNQSISENENSSNIKKSKSSFKGVKLSRFLIKKDMKYFYLIMPGNISQLVEKCLT